MTTWRQRLAAAASAIVLSALTGCATTPSPTPTTPSVDFTAPGAAKAILRDLVTAAATNQLIMVEITKTTASISVVRSGKAETWAYRTGTIRQVPTDTAYVDQAIFDVDTFTINDVGALFRIATAVAGSGQSQALQIVDFSAGKVMMTVTTVPESRTVFFEPDGTLLPTLDFGTLIGIQQGLKDALAGREKALVVSVGSATGAYVDYPGPDQTTIRQQRASRFPTTTTRRADKPTLPTFDVSLVQATAIWAVLDRARIAGRYDYDMAWSVTIDDRDGTGKPTMKFLIGSQRVTTDLAGNE